MPEKSIESLFFSKAPVVLVDNDVKLCLKRDQILLTLGFTSEVINYTCKSCGNARDDR